MKLQAYCMFDSKAAVFTPPFFVANDAVAIRSFSDFANQKGSMVNEHPADFSLFAIGSYDDGNGVMVSCLPRNMVTAAAVLAPKIDPRQLEMLVKDAQVKEVA